MYHNYKRIEARSVKEINFKHSKLKFIVLLYLHVSIFRKHRNYIETVPKQLWNGERGLHLKSLRIVSQHFQCPPSS